MGFPYHAKPLTAGWDKDKDELGDASSHSRDTGLGSTDTVAGSGTQVSGYVESPVAKSCGTCEYLVKGKFCKQETVLKDPEVPEGDNGLKMVNPKDGCCSFWEARKHTPEPPTARKLDQGSGRKQDARSPKVRLTFY